MAVFNATYPAVQTTASVGTSATAIYNTTTYTPPGGSALTFPTGVTLKDVTIVNTGTVNMFVGGSTVTTATGLLCPANGGQVSIRNWNQATGGGNVLYGVVASGSTSAEVSLAVYDLVV